MRTTRNTHTILLATAALLLGACGSDSEKTTTDETAATQTSAAAAAKPLPKSPNTPIPAGRHTTSVFDPGLELEIPKNQSWRTAAPGENSKTVALELLAGKNVALTTLAFTHITTVADPKRGARTSADAVKAPDDLIDWLTKHPHLQAEAPEEVTVGELPGRAVTVTADSAPKRMPEECVETSRDCVPVYFDGDEPVAYTVGDRVRFTTLEVGGEQIVVEQFAAPPEQFDRVLGLMEPVLKSIEIG